MKRRMLSGTIRSWAALLAIGLIIGLMADPASAQQAGTILGVVKDTSGGTVPEAKVTVTNTDTNDSRTINTGDDGAFNAPGLNPGHYLLKIEKVGFKTVNQTGLVLDVAGQLVVNPTLEIGTASQEVTVTGEAPVVNTTTSQLGGLVNDQQMAELPLNGRNYTDLTLLQPGVSQTTHSGTGDSGTWYSSNGMPPRSNVYTMDGALTVTANNTAPAAQNGSALGVDGIKEYKLVTSMFGAEYGLAMGSQMVIVSKSGTNQFHGDVFEFLRNNHLDARNFFEAPESLIGGGYPRLPQFQRNNFGAAVGGPIQKDKTFFFLVYEGLRLSQGDTIQDTTMGSNCHFVTNSVLGNVIIGGGPIPSSVQIPSGWQASSQMILQKPLPGTTTMPNGCGALPTATSTLSPAVGATLSVAPLVQPWIGQFPFPNEVGFPSFNYSEPGKTRSRDDYSQLRIDHTFSEHDNLFARYTIDDAYITTPYSGGTLGSTDTGSGYPQFVPYGTSRNQYVTLGENHVFSPTLLNSFRLSFARTVYHNLYYTPTTTLNRNFILEDAPNCATTAQGCIWSFVAGLPTGGFSPGSGVTGEAYPGNDPNYHDHNVWTLNNDVFWTKGKHSFKIGTMINFFQLPQLQSKGILGAYGWAGIYVPPNASSGTPATGFLVGIPTTINLVGPGQSVALNPGVPGATLLAPPYQGNFLDKNVIFKTYGFYIQDDWRATSRLTVNLGLRYEFRGDLTEEYGRESCIPNLETSNQALTTCGIMTNPSFANWSPRVGLAWDVFGNGKTAIRSGFGIYYDLGNYDALLTQGPTGMPPFVANTTYGNTLNLPVLQSCGSSPLLVNQVNCLDLPINTGSASAGKSLQGNDYNAKSVHALESNLTLSQQLPFGIGLDVSYVVARGIHLYDGEEGNPVVPQSIVNGVPFYSVAQGQAGCFNNALTIGQPLVIGGVTINPGNNQYPCRVNPYFSSAIWFTNAAQSWYNGLQVAVNKRLSQGLSMQFAYTYSKAEDDTQGTRYNDDCGGNANAPFSYFPFNLKEDWGPSCYNVTHVAHLNVIYHLPGIKPNAFVSKVTNGWWVSSIVALQGGPPFTPIISTDRAFDGVISQSSVMRASWNTTTVTTANGTFIPYNAATVITGNPNQWFNPYMFGEAPLGTVGNAPRDSLEEPGLHEWDFSIVKDTKLGFLGEGGNLQFRAEIFNVLNHANFSYPSAVVFQGSTALNSYIPIGGSATPCAPSPGTGSCPIQAPLSNAGQITGTATTARQIQLALKLYF